MSSQEVLVALRRITRAIDLRSKELEKQVGLTVPQLLILQTLKTIGELPVGDIARRVSLSQGTVTSVIHRLEAKGLLQRSRGHHDRRKVGISLTPEGARQTAAAPEMLQEVFISRFERLEPWERKMLVSSLERIASLMDAATVDASPILDIGDIATPGALEPAPLKTP